MIEHILGSILLTILVGFILLILLGFILRWLVGAYQNHRNHKDIKKDLCTDRKISNESDRISILNLFFDLGANKKAAQAIIDLEIIDKNWETISPSAGRRLKKHIVASEGYDNFISSLRFYYGESKRTEDFKLSIPEQINRDIEKLVDYEPTDKEIHSSLQDIKEQIIGAGVFAVGNMVGIPIGAIIGGTKMAREIPGITDRYYRINIQSNVKSPYLRTAEDMMTSSPAQKASQAVGFVGGFTAGDFFGDMIAGDDYSIEGLLIGLAFGVGASILTGKLFKKVGKWWKTRKFRNLRDEYHNSCVEFYNQIKTQRNNEILKKNLEKGPQYWKGKKEELRNDYEILNKNITGNYLQVLFEEAIQLTEKIISQISSQNKEFLNNINSYVKEEEYPKAVQTILAQEKILLKDMHGLKPYRKKVENKFSSLRSEFKLLKEKGVIKI